MILAAFFMIRTINAFVTVINVRVALSSALSHAVLSMQLFLIHKANKEDTTTNASNNILII